MVGVLATQVGHTPHVCHSTPNLTNASAPSPELTGTKKQAPTNPKHGRHLWLQVHSEGEQVPTPRVLE